MARSSPSQLLPPLLGALLLLAHVHAKYTTCKSGFHHWIDFDGDVVSTGGGFQLMNSYKAVARGAGFDGDKSTNTAGIFDEVEGGLPCNDPFDFPIAPYCAEAVFMHLGATFSQRSYSTASCIAGLFSDWRTATCGDFTVSDKQVAQLIGATGGACCWDYVEAFNKIACWAFTKYPQCRDTVPPAKPLDWVNKKTMAAEGTADGQWKALVVPTFRDSLFSELHVIADHAKTDDLLFTVSHSTEQCMRTAIGMKNMMLVASKLKDVAIKYIPFLGTLDNAIQAISTFAKGDWALGAATTLDAILHGVLDLVGGQAVTAALETGSKVVTKFIEAAGKWGIPAKLFHSASDLFLSTFNNQSPCTACLLASPDLLAAELPDAKASGLLCGFPLSASSPQEWATKLAKAYVTKNFDMVKIKQYGEVVVEALSRNFFTASLKAYRTTRMSEPDWTEEEGKQITAGEQEFIAQTKILKNQVEVFAASPSQALVDPSITQANEMLQYMAIGARDYVELNAGTLNTGKKIRLYVARWVFGWTAADVVKGTIRLANSTLRASTRAFVYVASSAGRVSSSLARNSFSWAKEKPKTGCRQSGNSSNSSSCPLPCSGETREYFRGICNTTTGTSAAGVFNQVSCKCKRPPLSGCGPLLADVSPESEKTKIIELATVRCSAGGGTWSDTECKCDNYTGGAPADQPNITITTNEDGSSIVRLEGSGGAPTAAPEGPTGISAATAPRAVGCVGLLSLICFLQF